MKITTLIENTTSREDLAFEHGLSLFIETGDHRILFDAGQTGAFADNAKKLGIDLSEVDIAILSHGHYDHSGGLMRFLECNQTALIYLRRDAFLPHFNAAGKYIGLDPELKESHRLIYTDDCMEIAEGITLYSCNDRQRIYPTDSAGLTVQQDDSIIPDDFLHEQYLLIEESGKKICISGCSHKGILNIAQWFQPDALIGGFHFSGKETKGGGAVFLEEAARCLLLQPTVYYTGHCTGTAQCAFMKKIMGERLQEIHTGSVIFV